MRKPLLIAHMKAQQHNNNMEFIQNKPAIFDAKDNNNLRTITNIGGITTEDEDANDIIYFSMNDKEDDEGDNDDGNDDDDDDDDDPHHFVSG